ncbi:MAG: EAL domain-containing protein [Methylotenera sp.]|nr:EAL domain-containing protein [Methylotenera sp.]
MTQQKTIRSEIRYLAMAAVVVALIVTFMFGAVYKIATERAEATAELKVLAEITALNSQTALLFNDKSVLEETLNALAPNQDIVYAEILTEQGKVLAQRTLRQRGGEDNVAALTGVVRKMLAWALGEHALVTIEHNVTLDQKTLGKVRIQSDMVTVWVEVVASIAAAIMAMILALIFSLLLIRGMLKDIMQPIERLTRSAANIAKARLYSQRVERVADDELGDLTDQFNLMLSEVEKHEQELSAQNNRLEHEVASRTKLIKSAMEEMQLLLNSMAEGAYGVDLQGNCTFVNKSFLRILGFESESEILGQHMHELIHHSYADGSHYPADACHMYAAYQRNQKVHNADEVFWRKDGSAIAVEYWAQPIVTDGVIIGAIATFIDISERKKSETELKIAATAFDAQESMMVMDANHLILRVNQSFIKMTGYNAAEVIGRHASMFRAGNVDESFYVAIWDRVKKDGSWQGEVQNRRKNGDVYPGHVSISAVKNQAGVITNYVSTLTDITTSKAAEEEIKNLAYYDSLTGLPNRRLLLDRLTQALTFSARSGKEGALLFIDLDHFKTLNDTEGHAVGDLLLQQVAARLTAAVREGDTVARLGGDEFVVMLEDLSDVALEAAAQTEAIGEKILEAISQPYQLGKHEHHSTSSIGATVFNDHQSGIDELLKQADIAMYQAKKAGRNTLRFFDPQMQTTINNRANLEGELRKALEREQFQLYYQIQVDDNGHALGAEVLIRWCHPKRGLISPFHFIPLAEETGLILPIGEWVLNTACAQLGVWQQQPSTAHLTLSVNVSAKQFRQPDFITQVQTAVQQHSINPARLKLELTESMLLEQIDLTIATMNALKEIGIRFSLDDFGTGYSSLQYLKKLPLYQLKIDQSFVRDIADDISDQAIVRTIIAMAQTLNLNVIAEGVETEQQRQLLQSNGCHTYQGYLFSQPVPIAEFEALMRGLP